MVKYTEKYIPEELREQHKKMCHQYRTTRTMDEVENMYHGLRAWWVSAGAVTEKALDTLELWLAFWHYRYCQWGGFMTGVCCPKIFNLFFFHGTILHFLIASTMYTQKFTEEELAEMPSCNLTESIHNKWLQASGNNGDDLYVATVDDFVRGFLQVVNYYQFLKGDVGGICPTKKELKPMRSVKRCAVMGYLGGVLAKSITFFSIIFATLTDKNDVIMDWQCGVGKHYLSALSLH